MRATCGVLKFKDVRTDEVRIYGAISVLSPCLPAELVKQGVLPRASLTDRAQESPGGFPLVQVLKGSSCLAATMDSDSLCILNTLPAACLSS